MVKRFNANKGLTAPAAPPAGVAKSSPAQPVRRFSAAGAGTIRKEVATPKVEVTLRPVPDVLKVAPKATFDPSLKVARPVRELSAEEKLEISEVKAIQRAWERVVNKGPLRWSEPAPDILFEVFVISGPRGPVLQTRHRRVLLKFLLDCVWNQGKSYRERYGVGRRIGHSVLPLDVDEIATDILEGPAGRIPEEILPEQLAFDFEHAPVRLPILLEEWEAMFPEGGEGSEEE